MLNIDQTQRRDIDEIQNDKIGLANDEYNTLDSPLKVNMLNYFVDGYNWIIDNGKFVKYNLVENDKLIFHVDKIDELLYKNIIYINVEMYIVYGDNNFIFNSINLYHDDIIKNKPFNIFIRNNYYSFECELFDYDDLDFITNGKGFDLELLKMVIKSKVL